MIIRSSETFVTESLFFYMFFYIKDNNNDLLRTAIPLDHEEPIHFVIEPITNTEKRTYEVTSDNDYLNSTKRAN